MWLRGSPEDPRPLQEVCGGKRRLRHDLPFPGLTFALMTHQPRGKLLVPWPEPRPQHQHRQRAGHAVKSPANPTLWDLPETFPQVFSVSHAKDENV